eukprot:CAMPEP_0170584652 /NCGR_PEP_ID=MMETSP0224-20130122/8797_1 /TAXON_ID=285029 /ORGANISM="Togula jolla, Strain CCCM 725" /LENGTH=65 /DNA_ID=CAMNT_0010908089 /DNA_START=766 /DNA_END=959 /DNA_ORIENTATION=+
MLTTPERQRTSSKGWNLFSSFTINGRREKRKQLANIASKPMEPHLCEGAMHGCAMPGRADPIAEP